MPTKHQIPYAIISTHFGPIALFVIQETALTKDATVFVRCEAQAKREKPQLLALDAVFALDDGHGGWALTGKFDHLNKAMERIAIEPEKYDSVTVEL